MRAEVRSPLLLVVLALASACPIDDTPVDGEIPDDAGSPDGGAPDGDPPDGGAPDGAAPDGDAAPGRCAIVDGRPRTFPVDTEGTLTLELDCGDDLPGGLRVRIDEGLSTLLEAGAATRGDDGRWYVRVTVPAVEAPGVRRLWLEPRDGARLGWNLHHHCLDCLVPPAEGLAGLPAGHAIDRLLAYRAGGRTTHVVLASAPDGRREARILDLEGGRFGDALALAPGEVATLVAAAADTAALVIVGPDAEGTLSVLRHPIVGTTFGRPVRLPTSDEAVEEILDVRETVDGEARGVAVLAALSDGGLLFDATSGGAGGSRRFRSLGAWNDRTPRARFGLVATPRFTGTTPRTSELAALVLTGDPSTGRHRLEVMTLPASGDPTTLGELSFEVPPPAVWPDHWERWNLGVVFGRGAPVSERERASVVVASPGGVEVIRLRARGDAFALELVSAPRLPAALGFRATPSAPANRRAFDHVGVGQALEDGGLRLPATQLLGGPEHGTSIAVVLSLRVSDGSSGSTAAWGPVEPARRVCRTLPELCRPADRRLYGNPLHEGQAAIFEADLDGLDDLEQDAQSASPRVTTSTASEGPPPRCEGHGVCSFGRCFCLDAEEQGVAAELAPGSGRFVTVPLDPAEIVLDLVPLDEDLVLVRSIDTTVGQRHHRLLRREGELLRGERRVGDPLLARGIELLQPLGARADGRVAMVVAERGAEPMVQVGSVSVSAEGELSFDGVVTLGGAPVARDFGLEALPHGMRAAMLPREVYLYALPNGPRDQGDLPVVPVDAHAEVVAVLRRDAVSRDDCPLATALFDARDLSAASVLSTSEANDCTGLEVPVGFARSGVRRVERELPVGAVESPLTVPWRPVSRWREEVTLSTYARRASQGDPAGARLERAHELFGGWDFCLDHIELVSVGDIDGDGLDDLWIDTSFLESGRPTLRRGGAIEEVFGEPRAAPSTPLRGGRHWMTYIEARHPRLER
ncbi:MAG: hypothetical protein KF901_28935 [Myxococcales bacterium]|nr:hypothetical protein [Myxococcales bacterium]